MQHIQNNIHVGFNYGKENNIFALLLRLRKILPVLKNCHLPSTPGASRELTVMFPV